MDLCIRGEELVESLGGGDAGYESLAKGEGCGAETVCCGLRS